MSNLLNRVKQVTTTTGTGTVTLGGAVTGFATIAEAGGVNATSYSYVLEEGNDFEIGVGTYTSSGTTFSRDTVTLSKISGTAGTSKMTLAGGATLSIVASVAEFTDRLLVTAARERLTANRIYYVRTDGNDANTGLTDTSGGAFLTYAKAIDVVAALDISIYDVTIQVGPGTWTAPVVLKSITGSGRVTLQGDVTTPANVTINVSGNVVAQSITGLWRVRGFKFTGSGVALRAVNAYVEHDSNEYATTGFAQILAELGGFITATGNYSISAASGSTRHWAAAHCASVQCVSQTITITGTPAFAAFAYAAVCGNLLVNSNTYSGSATGSRYTATMNGAIQSAGATLPGNAAGTTATGGQYA